VRAQIEGSVIQTVSRTLKEEVMFDRGMVTSLDWATYPILRFPELPELVIDLIDRPTEKPWGAGAVRGRRAFGHLQRDLRRHRSATAVRSVQTGESQSRATVDLITKAG
jgi:hypothetical protein